MIQPNLGRQDPLESQVFLYVSDGFLWGGAQLGPQLKTLDICDPSTPSRLLPQGEIGVPGERGIAGPRGVAVSRWYHIKASINRFESMRQTPILGLSKHTHPQDDGFLNIWFYCLAVVCACPLLASSPLFLLLSTNQPRLTEKNPKRIFCLKKVVRCSIFIRKYIDSDFPSRVAYPRHKHNNVSYTKKECLFQRSKHQRTR